MDQQIFLLLSWMSATCDGCTRNKMCNSQSGVKGRVSFLLFLSLCGHLFTTLFILLY